MPTGGECVGKGRVDTINISRATERITPNNDVNVARTLIIITMGTGQTIAETEIKRPYLPTTQPEVLNTNSA